MEPRPVGTGMGSSGGSGAATAARPSIAAMSVRRAGGLDPIAEQMADGPAQTNGTPALATPAVASLATSQQHDELDQHEIKRRKLVSRPSQPGTHPEGF